MEAKMQFGLVLKGDIPQNYENRRNEHNIISKCHTQNIQKIAVLHSVQISSLKC